MLEDEVTTVRPAGTDLECSGYHIIVLAHPYGGIVTSETTAPELYGAAHNSEIGGPGIVRMIYQSSSLALKNKSLQNISQNMAAHPVSK